MDPKDFFKQVPSLSTDEARKFLDARKPEECNLVDVRLSEEYEEGHLPGARLIPLDELASRIAEIDAAKPTIVYCRSGNRSRVGAATLLDAGFTNVVSMDGGLRAWHGLVADGPPEAGMAYFSSNEQPDVLIALAWALEEGSRRFYAGVAASLEERDAIALFDGLVSAEEHHKASLLNLYREVTGSTSAPDIPAALFSGGSPGEVMEGGMRVDQALAWTTGKGVNDILDLSIALESNAYDLYLKMGQAVKSDKARQVFRALAEEEKVHLRSMTRLLETRRFPEQQA